MHIQLIMTCCRCDCCLSRLAGMRKEGQVGDWQPVTRVLLCDAQSRRNGSHRRCHRPLGTLRRPLRRRRARRPPHRLHHPHRRPHHRRPRPHLRCRRRLPRRPRPRLPPVSDGPTWLQSSAHAFCCAYNESSLTKARELSIPGSTIAKGLAGHHVCLDTSKSVLKSGFAYLLTHPPSRLELM